MRVSLRDSEFNCANCGRPYAASELDRRMWCPVCRRIIVRRSAWVARIVSFVVCLGLAFWTYRIVGPAPRFLVAYIVMIVAAYFFLYKLTQRVAFELIRERGVRPAKTDDDTS